MGIGFECSFLILLSLLSDYLIISCGVLNIIYIIANPIIYFQTRSLFWVADLDVYLLESFLCLEDLIPYSLINWYLFRSSCRTQGTRLFRQVFLHAPVHSLIHKGYILECQGPFKYKYMEIMHLPAIGQNICRLNKCIQFFFAFSWHCITSVW